MKIIKNKLITSLALILSLSAFADTDNTDSSDELDYYVTVDENDNLGYVVTSGTLVLSTMPSWSDDYGLIFTTEGGGAISIAGDIEGSVTDNSRIIIDGGTLTTSSDIQLNNNEYAGGLDVTMVSGKISTSGTIELSEGLTSVDEGSSLSLDGIVSVGDEMDSILGSEGSYLVITRDSNTDYDSATVTIGEDSSLTLAGDITLGDYVSIVGSLSNSLSAKYYSVISSALAIADNSVVNSTIYAQTMAGINIGDGVIFSSLTAFDISENTWDVTNLDGDIVFYRLESGAGIGYNISTGGITLGGSTSVNTSEDMLAYDVFFDQVVGIYLSNSYGAVRLADGFSLSTTGIAVRDGGNTILEEIMEETGDWTVYTQGITLTLLGSATLEGDIISYGGITLEGDLYNTPGSSDSYIRELTVINGLISAGDSLYHNDITIDGCILALENSTLTTYSQTGDCYGALDIQGSLVLDNSTVSVGDTTFNWRNSLTLLNDSEITINGDLTLAWGNTFNVSEGSKATVTGDFLVTRSDSNIENYGSLYIYGDANIGAESIILFGDISIIGTLNLNPLTTDYSTETPASSIIFYEGSTLNISSNTINIFKIDDDYNRYAMRVIDSDILWGITTSLSEGSESAMNTMTMAYIYFDSGSNSAVIASTTAMNADGIGEQVNIGSFEFSSDGYLNYIVPEPSTYAAILGALTLAFVIYRRRK